MKNLTAFLSLIIIISIHAKAQQQIPNNSFENWSNGSEFSIPNSWYSLDDIYFPQTGIASVTKEIDSKSGNFAVKLKVPKTSGFGPFVGLGLGDVIFGKGLPYTDRPVQLSAWLKYHTVGNDSVALSVNFSQYNTLTKASDYLGGGVINLGGTQTTFTQFTIPIEWYSNQSPDSINVFISVGNISGLHGSGGSYIIVDDILLSNTLGITETTLNHSIDIIPNPSKDKSEIQLPTDLIGATISMFDITGKNVYSGTQTQLELSRLNSGIYFVQVVKNGYCITKKLIVE